MLGWSRRPVMCIVSLSCLKSSLFSRISTAEWETFSGHYNVLVAQFCPLLAGTVSQSLDVLGTMSKLPSHVRL